MAILHERIQRSRGSLCWLLYCGTDLRSSWNMSPFLQQIRSTCKGIPPQAYYCHQLSGVEVIIKAPLGPHLVRRESAD